MTAEDGAALLEPSSDATTVLTVFFEGTANPIDDPVVTQVGLFARLATGVDLTRPRTPVPEAPPPDRCKMAFDGCGVGRPVRGTLFAVGLREQCRQVIRRISTLVKVSGRRVVCNVLGLSRGACGAVFLGQMLADRRLGLGPEQVELNLLLFDPVPGNLVVTCSRLDVARLSTASHCKDLRGALHLRSVLALFPAEPLPDVAFHAPVLPVFPPWATVEVDAVLGCHQGALFVTSNDPACVLSFARIRSWLERCGTVLDLQRESRCHLVRLPPTCLERTCLELLDRELAEQRHRPITSRRIAHVWGRGRGAVLRRADAAHVNRYHRWLKRTRSEAERADEPADDGALLLDIEITPERGMCTSGTTKTYRETYRGAL